MLNNYRKDPKGVNREMGFAYFRTEKMGWEWGSPYTT
jgi:hypothetical protein